MTDQITSTDLDDWSRRNDAQIHLPTLVRRLIMATGKPGSIRIPAAEAVRLPGFDGIVEDSVGAPPFLPAGRSVWEMGTSGSPGDKAQDDYRKRTDSTPPSERAVSTYVAVTSRTWAEAEDWVDRKKKAADGWVDVRAYDGTAIATWLEQCPGPRGWLAEHLARSPFGRRSLRDSWADWSESTEPPVPTAVLLAGRRRDAVSLRDRLLGTPDVNVLAAASREEALAFCASAFLDSAEGDPSVREGFLERALVIDTLPSWREAASWETPHILIASFEDPEVDAALRNGHQVVLLQPTSSRDARLPRIDREEARAAWQAVGMGHQQADELAVAARRSLTSLRRRIGRAGHLRQPPWAERTDATLLAPLLLAGSWRDDVEGDMEVIAALSGREWRTLGRDLSALAAADDPPIQLSGRVWEFLDVVDGWDHLRHALTADDIQAFREQARLVLKEPDPLYRVDPAERWRANVETKYSAVIRDGISRTIAVMGSVLEKTELPGGSTGEQEAAVLVRDLMASMDEEQWYSLAPSFPFLAEGAPSQFLAAVESELDGGGS